MLSAQYNSSVYLTNCARQSVYVIASYVYMYNGRVTKEED